MRLLTDARVPRILCLHLLLRQPDAWIEEEKP